MRYRVEIWIKEIGVGGSCLIVVHSSNSNLPLDSTAELANVGGIASGSSVLLMYHHQHRFRRDGSKWNQSQLKELNPEKHWKIHCPAPDEDGGERIEIQLANEVWDQSFIKGNHEPRSNIARLMAQHIHTSRRRGKGSQRKQGFNPSSSMISFLCVMCLQELRWIRLSRRKSNQSQQGFVNS